MKQILCLSAQPWSTVPTRTQQLMTRLKDAKILFLDPPSRNYRKPGRKVRPGLTVYALPPAPEAGEDQRLLRFVRDRRLARYILRLMDLHRFREPLLWCTAPEQVHLLDAIPHQGLVYDCFQDWLDTPPEWESDLALAADVVFAASEGLADHLSPCSDNIALLPNGVSYPMFSRGSAECPEPLSRLTGPVLGFTGTIWEDLDLTPVYQAARAMPRCTFVFVGRREYNPLLNRLEALPNVRMVGRQLPVEIPDYLARFDVCLHLLRRSDYGGDVVPARIYEYLASGKPIVAMVYPDHVEHFPDVIYAAHSPGEFVRLCQHALEEREGWPAQRRREHGAAASWSNRAGQVIQILSANGLY